MIFLVLEARETMTNTSENTRITLEGRTLDVVKEYVGISRTNRKAEQRKPPTAETRSVR